MFPEAQNLNGPATGNQPTTSSIVQQNTSLLGNPQFQPNYSGLPSNDPGFLNNTAPQSSTTNPAIASMVKALKGGSLG